MAGGNHPKSSSHKQSSSSSSAHRKSRWESGNDPKPSRPNPSPKTRPTPSPAHPKPPTDPVSHSAPGPRPPPGHPFPFPDPTALGPPPPPAYGFHMLERRTIVLADGSVRSYFALPPDYQDFTPPAQMFLGPGAHGPELGASRLGFDKRFPPVSPRENRDYWNSVVPDGPGSMKRKYGGEEEKDRRQEKDEYVRQRQQLMQYGNLNGYQTGPSEHRGEFFPGTSSPFRRDIGGDELRAAKYMRIGGESESVGVRQGVVVGGGGSSSSVGLKHLEVDQNALKKAFLHFVKVINENAAERKSYLDNEKQGRHQCVACGRSSKDFSDMHGLIMHTYNSDNADLRVDHLGLHKALCVLMGWNFSKPPDNSKAYQFLPADEAAANQDDLIMWPPVVIIHNTITGKGKDGRMEGLGNKAMDNKIRDLGFGGGKSKSLYGKEGHLGITLVKFAGDQSGLKDAMQLAEYFEKDNHGRKGWARVQPLSLGKDDEHNPNFVKVDERSGEKRRILYGYLGTASDLDKVDFDTRKKVAIESERDYKASK